MLLKNLYQVRIGAASKDGSMPLEMTKIGRVSEAGVDVSEDLGESKIYRQLGKAGITDIDTNPGQTQFVFNMLLDSAQTIVNVKGGTATSYMWLPPTGDEEHNLEASISIAALTGELVVEIPRANISASFAGKLADTGQVILQVVVLPMEAVSDTPPYRIVYDIQPTDLLLEVTTTTVNQTFQMYAAASGYAYNYSIDYGDGSPAQTITTPTIPSHIYAVPGKKIIRIRGTIGFIGITTAYTSTPLTLTRILQWGATNTQRYIFQGASNLKKISGAVGTYGLASITTAQAMFYGTGIKELPDGLFANAANCLSIADICYNCTELTDIKPGAFSGLSKVTTMQGAFEFIGATTVPDVLFDAMKKATNARYLFKNSKIAYLPVGLFAGCDKLSVIDSAFENTQVTEIPNGFLDGVRTIISINSVFNLCAKLTTISETFLQNIWHSIEVYDWAFSSCTAVTSNVPAFWTTASYGASKNGCFRYTQNAANYSSIPVQWL